MNEVSLIVEPHACLDLQAFVTVFPASLGELESSPAIVVSLSFDEPAPFVSSDEIRRAVRDLLRHGGFKPTGRSKPASEYLVKAAAQDTLSPINVAVDACNVDIGTNGRNLQ